MQLNHDILQGKILGVLTSINQYVDPHIRLTTPLNYIIQLFLSFFPKEIVL